MGPPPIRIWRVKRTLLGRLRSRGQLVAAHLLLLTLLLLWILRTKSLVRVSWRQARRALVLRLATASHGSRKGKIDIVGRRKTLARRR